MEDAVCCRHAVQDVIASATVQHVVASIAVQFIVIAAVTAMQFIVAEASVQHVVAGTAVQYVVAGAAGQDIDASQALHQVVADSADQVVVPVGADDWRRRYVVVRDGASGRRDGDRGIGRAAQRHGEGFVRFVHGIGNHIDGDRLAGRIVGGKANSP